MKSCTALLGGRLELHIGRNELGHRSYTADDITRFMTIRDLKAKGLQLKAIKEILSKGTLIDEQPADTLSYTDTSYFQTDTHNANAGNMPAQSADNREEKAKRLHFLLKNMIRDALRDVMEESNAALARI